MTIVVCSMCHKFYNRALKEGEKGFRKCPLCGSYWYYFKHWKTNEMKYV